MPSFCAVIKCSNRGNRDKKRFFRVPAARSYGTEMKKQLSWQRQKAWIKALRRADFTQSKLKFAAVCEDHFISGKPADLFDTKNPDWVPSIKMGYEVVKEEQLENSMSIDQSDTDDHSLLTSIYQPAEGSEQPTSSQFATVIHLSTRPKSPLIKCGQSDDSSDSVDDPIPTYVSQGMETDLCMKDIDMIYKANEDYVVDILNVKEKLNKLEMNEATFENDDERTQYYTGFPSYQTLIIIFDLIKENLGRPTNNVSVFRRFILTLMHLKLHLEFQDLSYRFGISKKTISKTFYQTLFVMHMKLKSFVVWPERDVLESNMPSNFNEVFNSKVTIVADIFELQVQKPCKTQDITFLQTWCEDKQMYLVKFLIGLSAQGTVCFVSKAYGGDTSDKHLTEDCGILDQIIHGDVIITGRGFNNNNSIQFYCAQEDLLSNFEVDDAQNIASVKSHVERIIKNFKQKFKMFESTMPVRMLQNSYSDGSSEVEQLVTVCCALNNIWSSLIVLT